MKALVTKGVVVLAVLSGLTVSAEAKPVTLEPVSSVSSISITSAPAGVGVLSNS